MTNQKGNGEKKQEMVAVAIDKDKGSQAALKWAVDNLLGKGKSVTLVHVKHRNSAPCQIFELGFFARGTSSSQFLGIWYKATPDIIDWVANRNNPIIDSQGVLTLAKNGTLVLDTVQSATIWFSNSFRAASSPVLKLLDNGNLVLVDKLTADSSSQEGLTNGTKKRYRDILWNGHFIGFPILPDPVWKIEVESNRGRLISVFQPFNDKIKIRLTMNYSGSVQHYMMNEQKDGWILVTAMPSDKCDNYGLCGHNSICKSYITTVCECLGGFKLKSEKEWRLFNWKSGCNRNLTLDCQKEDGFLKFEGITFPDSLNFQLNTSMTTRECHDECLQNCSCMAYVDPYFNNESSFLMWFGDLIDIREHNGGADAGPSIYILRFACLFQNSVNESSDTLTRISCKIQELRILNELRRLGKSSILVTY